MLDTRLVVNSRLFVYSTAEARTGDPYEGPPAVVVDDERAAAVAQAGVHLATPVSGAKHLLVQLDGDGLLLVPRLALAVVDDRHVDL